MSTYATPAPVVAYVRSATGATLHVSVSTTRDRYAVHHTATLCGRTLSAAWSEVPLHSVTAVLSTNYIRRCDRCTATMTRTVATDYATAAADPSWRAVQRAEDDARAAGRVDVDPVSWAPISDTGHAALAARMDAHRAAHTGADGVYRATVDGRTVTGPVPDAAEPTTVVVPWDEEGTVHVHAVTRGLDSDTSKVWGVVDDGASGTHRTACGIDVYGVAGTMVADPGDGLCAACDAAGPVDTAAVHAALDAEDAAALADELASYADDTRWYEGRTDVFADRARTLDVAAWRSGGADHLTSTRVRADELQEGDDAPIGGVVGTVVHTEHYAADDGIGQSSVTATVVLSDGTEHTDTLRPSAPLTVGRYLRRLDRVHAYALALHRVRTAARATARTAATVPPLPSSLFTVARAAHTDCTACDTTAARAVTMARVTGSSVSAYADGRTHDARVQRVRRDAATA